MNNLGKHVGHSQADVVSRNLYPPRVYDMAGPINMLHTYGWEETGFPIEWVKQFNEHLDGIACQSEHVRKIMRDNGVSVPLTVVGNGVDHWERLEPSAHSILDEMDTKEFRFLHVSSCFPRKGADALLEAWCQAFSKTDDVCLVIKTFPNPHNVINEKISKLKSVYTDAAPIIVIDEDMFDADLKALYERCHVMVAPSYAEGFCLPIAEAMLSGIPAITTNWSGQLDFCSPNIAWLVDYAFEQTDTHFELHSSMWAKIDTTALARAMKIAYQTSAAEREKMARNGKDQLLENFTWDKVAKRLIDFRQDLQAEDYENPPSIGVISTWKINCGIAEYSKNLLSGFKIAPTILAAHNEQKCQPDQSNVIRCWTADRLDDLTELTKVIENRELDTLVIQFNYGFFNHHKLKQFIEYHKKSGRTVVIEMHSTNDIPFSARINLANYTPALELTDRVLAHSISDMNRLKEAGVINNAVLFPLGVIEHFETIQQKSPIPTIATYGFCLPHKGLEDIIDAIGILRDMGDEIKLIMVNAEYPAEISSTLIIELKTKIKQLNLEDKIIFETKFLSDQESLALLQASDLVVFPYKETIESSSAAARHGLASQKPILVTDIDIFQDLGDIVWRIDKAEPKKLAITIRKIIDKIRTNSPEHLLKQETAKAWREQHSFDWLSERLEGMLTGLKKDNQKKEFMLKNQQN